MRKISSLEIIFTQYTINGETVTLPRGKPILKPESIPTKFLNLPTCGTKRKFFERSSSFDVSVAADVTLTKRKFS